MCVVASSSVFFQRILPKISGFIELGSVHWIYKQRFSSVGNLYNDEINQERNKEIRGKKNKNTRRERKWERIWWGRFRKKKEKRGRKSEREYSEAKYKRKKARKERERRRKHERAEVRENMKQNI